MNIKGFKVNFLGDSITQGVGVENLENLYHARLAKKYGWDLYVDGISGTRIAPQNKPSEEPSFDKDFISRVKDIPADSEIVVFFGGTNDYGHGDAPLGEMSDRTVWTYYGALHVLLTALIEKYPTAQSVVLTPLHREDEEKRTPILKPFVDATRQVAEYYSLPVLDLWANYGIQPRIYLADTTDRILQANPGTLFNKILGNSLMASLMGTDIFYEMIGITLATALVGIGSKVYYVSDEHQGQIYSISKSGGTPKRVTRDEDCKYLMTFHDMILYYDYDDETEEGLEHIYISTPDGFMKSDILG